jgi:hypothetical protein
MLVMLVPFFCVVHERVDERSDFLGDQMPFLDCVCVIRRATGGLQRSRVAKTCPPCSKVAQQELPKIFFAFFPFLSACACTGPSQRVIEADDWNMAELIGV